MLHVLRVVQEALTNAVKHAGATRLRVRVDHDESGALFVDVTDNGVGMASIGRAARNGGRGVENMRERARSLGGELDLTAGDSGTSVRLRMPAVGPSAPRGAEA